MTPTQPGQRNPKIPVLVRLVDPGWVSLTDTAFLLGMHPVTLRKDHPVRQRMCPTKIGRTLRVPAEDVVQILTDRANGEDYTKRFGIEDFEARALVTMYQDLVITRRRILEKHGRQL